MEKVRRDLAEEQTQTETTLAMAKRGIWCLICSFTEE